MKSPWSFKQYGESGIPVSDLFPHVGGCADDLCVIRSMVGEGVDHGAALLQSFTESSTFTRPSMGSWVVYGLGSENQDLPGFVTIKPALSHGGAKNWSSAFLPGSYQGTAIGNAGMNVDDIQGEPIEYLLNKKFTPEQQRYELDMLQNVNRKHAEMRRKDPQLGGSHPGLRAGVPDAGQSAVGVPGGAGIGGDQEAVRPGRSGHSRFRLVVPAGPPFGRERRSLHPVYAQLQVGPARPTLHQAHRERPRSG